MWVGLPKSVEGVREKTEIPEEEGILLRTQAAASTLSESPACYSALKVSDLPSPTVT